MSRFSVEWRVPERKWTVLGRTFMWYRSARRLVGKRIAGHYAPEWRIHDSKTGTYPMWVRSFRPSEIDRLTA